MELYPTCMCLIHKWTPEDDFPYVEKEKVARIFLRHWEDFFQWEETHSANIAIRKEVTDKVRWRRAPCPSDRGFLLRCLRVFHKTMMIDAPLIQYRNELSSFNKGDAIIQ